MRSRQMGWSDVSRAIAHFTDIQDASLLDSYCSKKRLPLLPMAVAHGDSLADVLALFGKAAGFVQKIVDRTREKHIIIIGFVGSNKSERIQEIHMRNAGSGLFDDRM